MSKFKKIVEPPTYPRGRKSPFGALPYASGGPVAGMDAYSQALQQSGYSPTANVSPPPAQGGMSQSQFNRSTPIDAETQKLKMDNLKKALEARDKAMKTKKSKGGLVHAHHDVHHLIGQVILRLAAKK